MFTTRGASKTYRYADIRAWDARKETSGKVVGHSMQAIGVAAAMDREAKLNTGLFVTVRDVDHPQWRVSMKIENVRLRWVEILRQEINEGGVTNVSAT